MVDRCISSHYSAATYPSFSSTLLDAIYRSIDDSVETETLLSDHNRHEPTMKLNQNNLSVSENCIFKQEIVAANYQRACMIEKWMEKTKIDRESRKPTSDLKAKAASRKFRDDEKLSSNSSSSTSCSSDHHQYYFSSSEPESFHVLNPKQVRNGCSGFDKVEKILVTNREIRRAARLGEGSELIPKLEGDDGLLKTKSRALKIYGDLKKVKQPISPGAKITGFLSLLFSYKNPRKKMNMKGTAKIVSDNNDSPSAKSTNTSTTSCSSASSFSRSCLSKTPSSGRKSSNNSAVTRSVRISITDEDYKSHGHSALDQDDKDIYCKKTPDDDGFSSKDYIGSVELMAARVMEKNRLFDIGDSDEDDDDDDAASYESSDLFELDNLSSIGLMDGDELPVYETTRLQKCN